MKTMQEAFYYNAVAVALDGNYGKIVKLKHGLGNWKSAQAELASRKLAVDAEKEWGALAKTGVGLVLLNEAGFPARLKEIPRPPFGIYALGTLPDPDVRTLAIVGTRRATPEGKDVARRFARELARAGLVIVSGLAFGIDTAAHEGCLDARGATIAVLAGGLNDIYPRENKKLAERILAGGGAIISEYPLNSPPYSPRFIERNRLISGLAEGVLIVQAPKGSGSLATGWHAMEQNRDVFVVPGPVTQPHFAGSHQLIRQGAELVTAPDEILESYGVTQEEKISAVAEGASPEEKQVLEALRTISRPAEVDKIAAATTLELQIVNRALAFLLLKGLIKEEGGGYTI